MQYKLNGVYIKGDVVSKGVLIPFGNLSLWSAQQLAAYNIVTEPDPPPAAIPTTIPDITRRQFFQQLAIDEVITQDEALAAIGSGVIPSVLSAIIDSLPDTARFGARCLLVGATSFERNHPMVGIIATARAMSSADVDAFFLRAYSLN